MYKEENTKYYLLQRLPLTRDPSLFISEDPTWVWWSTSIKGKPLTLFCKFQMDFEQFPPPPPKKKNSKYIKTTNFKVNYSFKEKISFNMLKNWRFMQPGLYDCWDCDPPTIHHASLSCTLSRAVKFKILFYKYGFCKRQLFFLFQLAWKSSLIKLRMSIIKPK